MWLDTFYINSRTRDRTCEKENCMNYVKLSTAEKRTCGVFEMLPVDS